MPELDAGYHGLTDFAEEHNVKGILHTGEHYATLGDIITSLNNMYCGPLSAEFAHLLVSVCLSNGKKNQEKISLLIKRFCNCRNYWEICCETKPHTFAVPVPGSNSIRWATVESFIVLCSVRLVSGIIGHHMFDETVADKWFQLANFSGFCFYQLGISLFCKFWNKSVCRVPRSKNGLPRSLSRFRKSSWALMRKWTWQNSCSGHR